MKTKQSNVEEIAGVVITLAKFHVIYNIFLFFFGIGLLTYALW